MAAFPTWIKKNQIADSKSSAVMSPRQTANKAYSLGLKKLDKDEKRRRPQYSIREKLLLSNTLVKAEQLLNKQASVNRKSWCEQGDVLVPSPHYAPPSDTKVQQWMSIEESKQTSVETKIKTHVATIPEQVALSIAVIAAAFQQQEQSKQQHTMLCRPIHIPPYPFNSLTPIV
ncbi:hypothetical protein BD560DRAFT_432010 [Blakeslea trispora]|nr:hypothetical protein BD560DRAFT_432010 [Blakeslea trispora]